MARQRRRNRAPQPEPTSFPLPALLGALAIFFIIAAVVVISRVSQGGSSPSTGVQASTTPVVTQRPAAGVSPVVSTPTSEPPPTPSPGPTPPDAAFMVTDRCVTVMLERVGGDAHIRGGGLDITVHTPSVSELSRAALPVADEVCARTLTRAEVDDLVRRVGQVEGVTVVGYTYPGS
jgi:hypothetical protein